MTTGPQACSVKALLEELDRSLVVKLNDNIEFLTAYAHADPAAIGRATEAKQNDTIRVKNLHTALRDGFNAWDEQAKREGLGADAGSATDLFNVAKSVDSQFRLLEARYSTLTHALAMLEEDDPDGNAVGRAVQALQSYREAAHECEELLNALDLKEKEIALVYGRVFQGQLDPSRFTDIRPFGGGGVAIVERAYDKKAKREVVLKTYKNFLPNEGEGDVRSKESAFANQLATKAHVDIPGAERTYGFYFKRNEHGQLFPVVVAEFIEGESLAVVRSRGAVNEDYVRTVFEGVGPILQKLTEHGVIHRDVSPPNIIVRPAGAPTPFAVIDFHNAISAPEGETGTIMGANLFAPPEQLAEGYVDATTPYFGLARTGLGLLIPDNKALAKIVFKILARELIFAEDVPELAKQISPQLAHVIENATAHDKSLRYKEWKDMSYELSHWKPGQMTLREKLHAAKKIVGTSSGKWGALWGMFIHGKRVKQTQLVTSAPPVASLPAPSSWLVSAKYIGEKSKSDRFPPNASGKWRLLYPQEQFALLKRGLVDQDPAYAAIAADMLPYWEWTGVAIRRTDAGVEVWYDCRLTWDSVRDAHVPSVRRGALLLVQDKLPSGRVPLSSLPDTLKHLWGDAYEYAQQHDAFLMLPPENYREWCPVSRDSENNHGWSLYALPGLRNLWSRPVGLPGRTVGSSGQVASEQDANDYRSTEFFPQASESWLVPANIVPATVESQTRFTGGIGATGRRLLYPQELFAILKRGMIDNDRAYRNIANNMIRIPDWVGVALRRIANGIEVWYDPTIVWDETTNSYVELSDASGGSRFSFVTDVAGGFIAVRKLPPELAFFWGDAYDIAVKTNAGIALPGVNDGRWWPVAHWNSPYSSMWSLVASSDKLGDSAGASRWVNVLKKKFGRNEVIASSTEKANWVIPLIANPPSVMRGASVSGRFDVAKKAMKPIGQRLPMPREYFETLKYTIETQDKEYWSFVEDAWTNAEWCDVAFEWDDEGFRIHWQPDIVWSERLQSYIGSSIPLHVAPVDAHGLVEGFNALSDCPPILRALYGNALAMATERDGGIYLQKGLWPVARGNGTGMHAWSLVASSIGGAGYRWISGKVPGFEDSGPWISYRSEEELQRRNLFTFEVLKATPRSYNASLERLRAAGYSRHARAEEIMRVLADPTTDRLLVENLLSPQPEWIDLAMTLGKGTLAITQNEQTTVFRFEPPPGEIRVTQLPEEMQRTLFGAMAQAKLENVFIAFPTQYRAQAQYCFYPPPDGNAKILFAPTDSESCSRGVRWGGSKK